MFFYCILSRMFLHPPVWSCFPKPSIWASKINEQNMCENLSGPAKICQGLDKPHPEEWRAYTDCRQSPDRSKHSRTQMDWRRCYASGVCRWIIIIDIKIIYMYNNNLYKIVLLEVPRVNASMGPLTFPKPRADLPSGSQADPGSAGKQGDWSKLEPSSHHFCDLVSYWF